MPIQTRGFGVDVMPQYTPADPSLVAFNPQAITGGVLSTIQIANELAKRKAFLAQQAEQDAIRSGRILATNAQNQGITQVAPRQALADIALADKTTSLAPGQVELGMAQNKGALADLAFNEELRPITQEGTRLLAEANTAAAPIQSDVIVGGAKNAARKVQEEAELGPLTQELAVSKTQDAINSVVEDKRLSDEQKIATIRHLNAQAKQAEANADYLNRDKPKAGGGADELQKALGHVEMSIQRLENAKVTNPNVEGGFPVPLITYQGQVHEPTGAIKNQDKFLQFLRSNEPMMTDPRAERNSGELQKLYALRDKLNSQLTSGIASDAGIPLQAPAPVAPVVKAPPAQKVFTPQEAAKLPSGTVFTGTDGKQHVRK